VSDESPIYGDTTEYPVQARLDLRLPGIGAAEIETKESYSVIARSADFLSLRVPLVKDAALFFRMVFSRRKPEVKPREPKVSVFSYFVSNVAKDCGITLSEAADRLYDLGVRGFDAGVFDANVAELATTLLKPVNFYYFAKFSGEDGGAKENARALDVAVKYGVPRIMTIPPNFTEGGDEEAEFVRNTACLKKFVAMAKQRGVTVTVEDFGGTDNACSHAKYLKRMLDEIPDLRFALDSGNLYYAGRGEDVLDLMAHAKGRIVHVHLKDQAAEDGHKYVSLGLGAVPNEKIVKTTWADGYDGWYTLENGVGDFYVDTARQISVLKAWCSGR